GEFVADVVEFAVEPGDRPAEAFGRLGGGGNVGGGSAPAQHRFCQGDDQELLRLGQRHGPDGGLAHLGSLWGGCLEVWGVAEDANLVGGGAGGEQQRGVGGHQGQAGRRGE